jgi:hypothetical protein
LTSLARIADALDMPSGRAGLALDERLNASA